MNSPSLKESRNDMVVFTCKDRFDDMMTCIYEAWASHLGHNNIKLRTEPLGTMELFCEYRHVEADRGKTESVIRTIQQRFPFVHIRWYIMQRWQRMKRRSLIVSIVFNIDFIMAGRFPGFATESDRNEKYLS